jgi:hypothetical protein
MFGLMWFLKNQVQKKNKTLIPYPGYKQEIFQGIYHWGANFIEEFRSTTISYGN